MVKASTKGGVMLHQSCAAPAYGAAGAAIFGERILTWQAMSGRCIGSLEAINVCTDSTLYLKPMRCQRSSRFQWCILLCRVSIY